MRSPKNGAEMRSKKGRKIENGMSQMQKSLFLLAKEKQTEQRKMANMSPDSTEKQRI